eukprot:m.18985 g.18985  ORF g.18985 m.18985 type:complete len:356 (+) comp3394_c0_seq1:44-1111(+)
MESNHPHIGIICVSKHEFVAFKRELETKIALEERTWECVDGVDNTNESRLTYKCESFLLTLFTFRESQGPVSTAMRTAQIVTTFRPALHYLGLVGTCGGCKLGTVIFGAKAVDALGLAGREASMDAATAPPTHLLQSSTHVPHRDMPHTDEVEEPLFFPKFERFESFKRHCLEMSPPLEVCKGVLLTCHESQWTDRLPELEPNEGLDAEAYAFYRTLSVLAIRGLTPLPVVKAVSDVHVSCEGDEHNVAEMSKVSGPLAPDHKELLYRRLASNKAAQAMLAYLLWAFPKQSGLNRHGVIIHSIDRHGVIIPRPPARLREGPRLRERVGFLTVDNSLGLSDSTSPHAKRTKMDARH